MKLIINKKNKGEAIHIEIDAGATVNELLFLLYNKREDFLSQISFDVYQKIVIVHVDDLYAERLATQLIPNTHLSQYLLNEDSCITLEYAAPGIELMAINSLISHGDLSLLYSHLNKTGLPFFSGIKSAAEEDKFLADTVSFSPPCK